MKTCEEIARESVARVEWFRYVRLHAKVTIWIDMRVMTRLGKTLPEGSSGVGPELFTHYVRLKDMLPPRRQLEYFMRNESGPTCTVYWANIDGKIYACAEPMFPFASDN